MRRRRLAAIASLLFGLGSSLAVDAASAAGGGPAFSAGGRTFATWREYYASEYFAQTGRRCGKPKSVPLSSLAPSDCSFTSTNPSSEYDTVDIYQIPVVVHIIESTSGLGQISDLQVQSQIDVLNEDFRALAGTPGASGYDVGIQFVLAAVDPGGSPTTGITRSVNDTWFADGGNYWNVLAWDTSRYMNIYTNEAGGNLGYVPSLPQSGLAGDPSDRIVILWSAFGRDSFGGPPYDQGRSATHEVGHYLGLEHTFTGGCASATPPSCYSSGDLLCDTNPEATGNFGCPGGGATSCGSPDPIENYMDYSDDTCMDRFTDEQSHRIRCSLLSYRSTLYAIADPGVCGNDLIEFGEPCDGTDPGSCPTGICDPDCTCEDPVCGNDLAEAGETCDGTDDAACPGDCLGTCSCPTICGNGACDAGEDATSCGPDCGCASAGACGGQAPDGCYCDTDCVGFGDCCPDACPACGVGSGCGPAAACGSTPKAPCRSTSAFGATLTIRDRAADEKDRLIFKIKRGGATVASDFLDPLTVGKTASLCVYDGSSGTQPLLAAAVASAGTCGTKDCWKAISTSGFKYVNKTADPAGISHLRLRTGIAGKAQVHVKAKGALLQPPAPPLQFPVTVQFLVDDGGTTSCWQSEFGSPLQNEPGVLHAKGP